MIFLNGHRLFDDTAWPCSFFPASKEAPDPEKQILPFLMALLMKYSPPPSLS